MRTRRLGEWNRRAAEISSAGKARADELKVIALKLANLVDAIEHGRADPGVRQRCEDLRLGADLLEQVALACTARPKLDQLEVAFDERDHAQKRDVARLRR